MKHKGFYIFAKFSSYQLALRKQNWSQDPL